MHPRKQLSLTRKGQIHVLKLRSELSVPGSDTTNARPLTAKETKSETVTTKLSTPEKIPSHLERFARENKLVVEIEEYPDVDKHNVHIVPRIRLQEAVITDPVGDPFLVDILGSKKEVEQALEESQVQSPLLLLLMSEQINRLKEAIEFDLPIYDYECALSDDPNSSNWGGILHRTGVRYLYGCDEGVSLLFSSRDGAAVALALALARIR